MAGDFERDRPAVESHNFRNPLDEVENMTRSTYSYSAHNTSNTNNHNGLSSRRSQEVPVGNLLDGFEIIDNFESCSRERTLIDVDEPPTKPHRRSENDLLVTLVTKRTIGLQFDKRNGQFSEGREIEICPGTLVREMADDDWKTPKLKDWVENRKLRQEGLAVPMEDLKCDPTMCAMLTSSEMMKISQEEAMHLLSVNPSERLELFCEVERFNYIFNLKIGDPVLVDQDVKMRRTPAKVTWIGERPHESGIWYHVDFDSPNMQWPPNHSDRLNHYQFENQYNSGMSGSSSVAPANSRHYFSANQLHMPMKGGTIPTTLYDNRKPVTTFNGVNKDDEYRTAPKPAPRERIIPITQQVDTERPSRSIRPTDSGYNSFSVNSAQPPHASTSSLSPAPAQPSRSKSANNIKKRNQVAEYNEPVENEQLVFRIGDPCVWNNNGKEEKGIVRYIGFLKGHKMLYAGVEFNNRIGAGTGVFNKEQLFESRDGHAGFVELASLESPSTLHKRRLSSSRSQQMPAAAGTSNGARHYSNGKQASNESLSDPPPPPYAPPSPPRGTGHNHQLPPPIPPKPTAHVEDFLIEKFELGSLVVVEHLGAERTGVVRWLGEEMDEQGGRLVRSAIVELDGEVPPAWRRGNEAVSFTGTTNFPSALVPVHALRRNRSASGPDGIVFPAATSSGTLGRRTEEFGTIDSGIEKQKCAPAKDAMQLVGRMKGIQGHCNSCYIDATLYAMFAQTSFFDFLLEKTIKGSEKASQFQKILAQEIVFPLRKFHYVRADHVMKLRKLLAELMPHVSGLTSEEKDPEEILAFIFAEIFNADPFIKLLGPNNSKDSQYLVPIVVDDWQGGAATSQHLLERHMRSAQVTFAKPPPVLIMQLPRYGQQKVFDKILPLETIDITPFVAGATPACAKCGACSDLYCPTCFLTRRVFFTEIVFCHNCFRHSHYLPEIQDHEPRLLHAPGKSPKKPNSCKMVLSAVLCIETSHYVAYVKTSANQWLFFDSMADREGLSDGFNVPVVQECGNMSDWLSLQGWNRLKDADETGQIKAMFGKAVLDPLVGRLLSDSYICFYEEMSTSSPSATSQFFSTLKNRMN